MAYVDIPVPEHGNVTVKRSGQYNAGYPTAGFVRRYEFTMNEAFSFEAHPNPGYEFVRWCGDPPCSFSVTNNPFVGSITAETGYIAAVFRELPPSKSYVDGELSKLREELTRMGKRVDESLAGFRQDIDNALMPLRAAQDALRREIDSIWGKMYGWLVDRILNVLLSALDRTADSHVRETYKIVPEGPSWSRGELGTPDNATTLPFDPVAAQEASERIAEMRNQAWKSKRGMM